MFFFYCRIAKLKCTTLTVLIRISIVFKFVILFLPSSTKFPTYVVFHVMPSTYLPSVIPSSQYPGGTPCEYDPLFRMKDYRLPRYPVSVCDSMLINTAA